MCKISDFCNNESRLWNLHTHTALQETNYFDAILTQCTNSFPTILQMEGDKAYYP